MNKYMLRLDYPDSSLFAKVKVYLFEGGICTWSNLLTALLMENDNSEKAAHEETNSGLQ